MKTVSWEGEAPAEPQQPVWTRPPGVDPETSSAALDRFSLEEVPWEPLFPGDEHTGGGSAGASPSQSTSTDSQPA